ncbi:hypothetical protein [Myroides odoratus]|uniref:hypothetical protein n=1 Tax=Myroides odoratus TaxID=256 RepID=UPI000765F85D|nr:hypothetical protein [Myroides odoratus]
MKNLFSFLLIFFLTNNMFSQVTIGSSFAPNNDALLDLKTNLDDSSSKGLLLPRVALLSKKLATPLTTHVNGMFVYNTSNINSEIFPGCYYNNGVEWIRVGNSDNIVIASNGLTTTGNNITLGGSLSTSTSIYDLSDTNKFSFKGRGKDALNLMDAMSFDATKKYVGIGDLEAMKINGIPQPTETLHVQGTARITGTKLTNATTIMGRDNLGNVTNVRLGPGLVFSNDGAILNLISASSGLSSVGNSIVLGGQILRTVGITNISESNKFYFKGTGQDALNLMDAMSFDATKKYVGIGNLEDMKVNGIPQPKETLDVQGTARISQSKGTNANTITGRDVLGNLTDVKLGSGFTFSNGTLNFNSSNNVFAFNGLTTTGSNILLGGPLSTSTSITGISNTNKFSLKGTGQDALNFVDAMSFDATNKYIGIGNLDAMKVSGIPQPRETLHVEGTARISQSKGTNANTITGRDALGNITDVRLGNSLYMQNGVINFGAPDRDFHVLTGFISSGTYTQKIYGYNTMTYQFVGSLPYLTNATAGEVYRGTINTNSKPANTKYIQIGFDISSNVKTKGGYLANHQVFATLEVVVTINDIVVKRFNDLSYRYGGYDYGKNDDNKSYIGIIPLDRVTNLVTGNNTVKITVRPSNSTFHLNVGTNDGSFEVGQAYVVDYQAKDVVIQVFEK